MKKRTSFAGLAVAGMAAAATVFSGCNNSNSNNSGSSSNSGSTNSVNTNSAIFVISPGAVALNPSQPTAVFKAENGTAPYIWNVSQPQLGLVPQTSSDSVTYSRTTNIGINVISVTDHHGWTAQAQVIQD